MPRTSRGPEEGTCQVSSLAPAKQPATPSPASPSRFYLTVALTSGSGTLAASLSRADAETPLTSTFPEAPCAGCFRSAGPRRRGEAKPHVAMEMRPGWGRGCLTTMTALRFGLASCLSPRIAQCSVFRLKGKEKKERILPLG